MLSFLARILSALFAGMVFAVFWGGLTKGVGHATLGLAIEPQESFAPFRWEVVPADRPIRVLLLGTSLTHRGDWPMALQAQLSACRAGGVVVERLAMPGANSVWGAQALKERLANGPLPDALVLEFSINDASLWHGVTLAQSDAQHRAILQLAQRATIPVWLATMSPAFGQNAWERPGQVAYRALYHDLAKEQGVGLISLAVAWQSLPAIERAAALPDGLHPTDTSMVDVAVPAIAKALAAIFCP